MKLATRVVLQHAILLFLTIFLSAGRSTAQNNPAPAVSRITQAVDENNLVPLQGNVHPLARAEFDRGPVPSDLALNRMLLVLSRSPEQAGSLQALLDQQQDRSSPQYHRWLTPQQFGQQFGPSDSDIAQITSWLQIHGFHDVHVSNGRVTIEFSGTAGQVQEAFRTSIHRYVVNGAEHWANANDQQIPSALAPVVAGVFTLHNFLKAPQSQAAPQAFSATVKAGKRPQFTASSGLHALAPADFYTIYNFNPLQPLQPPNSVHVAIVARTNINVDDVVSFHAFTGDNAQQPNVLVNGPDPGDLGGGEEVEAVLDATWAGAMIPQGSTTLVVSQSTATSDGVDLSENYIIDNNLADVMSESFSGCEAGFTSAEATAASNLAQQAAAEGITYVVSSGDSGAEGCDDPSETVATHPSSVNLLASNPYVLAVGGTIFNEGSIPSNYWSATNNSNTLSSAISYIPENVWNESCQSGQPNCSTPSISAGGGGASTFFTKPSWQTGVAGIPADNARDLPDVSLTAAGHTPYLICLDGSCVPDANGFIRFFGISGTSASAQAFAGIMANVASKAGVRLGQPNYVLYRLANAETLSQCNASSTTTLPASSCVFNDVTVGNNAVPGQLNYGTPSAKYQSGVGYDLATGLGSVNVTNLINQWNTVTFNATSTAFSVSPTTATHGDPINVSGAVAPNSGTGMPTGVVWLTQNGYFKGILTGDGTVDTFKLDGTGSYSGVTHLLPGGSYQVNAYYPGDGTYGGSSSPTPTFVTISAEPTTLTFSVLIKNAMGNLVPFTSVPYGTPIYFQAQVGWQSGYGSPTGEIDCYAGSDSPFANVQPNSTLGGYSLSNAVTRTPVGSYSATAVYGGDYSFQLSRQNTPVNFSITSVSTQTSLSSQQTSLGLLLFVTISGGGSGVGVGPTGQITFTNGVGGPTLGTAGVSGGYASFNVSQLAPGQYNFVAAYSGDGNYGASTSAPFPMTLTADFIIATEGTTSQTVTPGQTAMYIGELAIVPLSGYSSTVKVSCTVPAAGTTCSVNPSSYVIAQASGIGSVTITTTRGAAAVRQPAADPSGPPPFHLPASRVASLTLLLCLFTLLLTRTRRRRFAMPLALLLLTAALGPIGCGGGNSGTGPSSPSSPQAQGTPAGNYTVTVTATAGSTTHTTTLTLIVQ